MHDLPLTGRAMAVAAANKHAFHKLPLPEISLLAGLGVQGDAHCGATVQHLSRVAVDPTQPNLRQVHLIHAELFEALAAKGFAVSAGQMGENITTSGLNLLDLPRGSLLHLGETAAVEVTGLRNPCAQLDAFQPGLMQAVLGRAADGSLIRKAGIMGIVLKAGVVKAGDVVRVALPALPHERLERV